MSKSKDTSIILDGFGLKVQVQGGHLILEDGVAENRRTLRLSKVDRISRLVILGHSGFFTFEAMRWLHDRNCAVVIIDMDGSVVMAETAMKVDYPNVRRAQAIAPATPAGLTISKWMMRMKLEAQQKNVPGSGVLADSLSSLEDANTIADVRDLEGVAAADYWSSWGDLVIRFDRRVPEHWKRFDSRHSAINPNGNRKAADPVNAMLNFAYGCLEAEARIACLALGLDLALGFNHCDERGRENLVFDIMEPVRPVVDRFIMDLIGSELTATDFTEDRYGHVRCLENVTSRIVREMPTWRAKVSLIAEGVAQELDSIDVEQFQPESVKKVQRPRPFPTPLTQRNQKRGQGKAA